MMTWRLLASVLGDRRQPQKMKREQAVQEQGGHLAGLPECQPVHEPRRRACLAFTCLVRCPLRCGDLGVILACELHFRVDGSALLAMPNAPALAQ